MIQLYISDLEQCWLHGFKAFHQNQDDMANPYTRGTKQCHYWTEGWWEAFYNTGNLSTVYQDHYKTIDVESLAS
jgi:hypothetical protein